MKNSISCNLALLSTLVSLALVIPFRAVSDTPGDGYACTNNASKSQAGGCSCTPSRSGTNNPSCNCQINWVTYSGCTYCTGAASSSSCTNTDPGAQCSRVQYTIPCEIQGTHCSQGIESSSADSPLMQYCNQFSVPGCPIRYASGLVVYPTGLIMYSNIL